MLYSFSSVLSFVICKCFFKLKVVGRDCLPKKGSFIIASNHLSNADPVVVGATAFPRKVNFLAKEELFCNRLVSFILKDLGSIPLKMHKADIDALKSGLKVLKEKPLVIFPQGVRTDSFEEFSAGVGFLAKKAGVPVVAVRIYGTDKILPLQAKFPQKGKITIIFSLMDNIEESDDYRAITLKVKERIMSL